MDDHDWSWGDDPVVAHAVDRALVDGPPPWPGRPGVHEVAVLAWPGPRWGAVDVIWRDADGTLDDDLSVARRLPDGTWDEPSSSGGGMPEEVFDRASQRPWQLGRRTSDEPFLGPLPRRGEGGNGLLWYLGDHVAGFDVDGVATWAVAFVAFALPGVTAVEFAYGPDTVTVPVPEHGLVLGAGELVAASQRVRITALDASGRTVDVLEHVPFTGPDDPRWSRPAWFRAPPDG